MSRFDLTRRGLLRTGMIAGAGLAMPTVFTSSAYAYTNEPKGKSVTLGFNVPQSGPYADEGADELKAFKLAVKHLNGEGDGGMMGTFSSKVLKGNGVLGKKVEFVTGDTQTKSDAARASAKSMIEKDGAVMISGGSSSGVAVAVQSLCQEAGIIFMAGLTHSNDTTGKDKKANGFRHFFDAYMSAAALAPVLSKQYGKDRKFYMLTADYTWGWTQAASMKEFMEGEGWQMVKDVKTPLASTDFSSYLAPVLSSGADVLILNHYGGNMVNSLTQAVQFGMRDKQVNGKQFEIVVPLISELMAKGAGKNIQGILGSTAPVAAVIDADLQHDETRLRAMYDVLAADPALDLVIGSRDVAGGSSSGGLSRVRQWGSERATALTLRLLRIHASDPMSGFFMVRRPAFNEVATGLQGQGFKLLADMLAAARGRWKVAEVPYEFRPRVAGESKMDGTVALEFLGLLITRLTSGLLPIRLVLFGFVGLTGVFVQLAVVRLAMAAPGLGFEPAQALGVVVAMTSNFALNNAITWRERRLRGRAFLRGLISFYAVCSVGALINLGVASAVFHAVPEWALASVVGAVAGAIWNFWASLLVTWRAP